MVRRIANGFRQVVWPKLTLEYPDGRIATVEGLGLAVLLVTLSACWFDKAKVVS